MPGTAVEGEVEGDYEVGEERETQAEGQMTKKIWLVLIHNLSAPVAALPNTSKHSD